MKATKSSRVPILPVTKFLPCAQCSRNSPQEAIASAIRGRCFRAADARFRHRAQHGVNRIVVQLEIFLRRTMPIVDVRFVPDFPKPLLHFVVAVTFAQMLRQLKSEFGPFRIIFRRIGPSGKHITLRKCVTVRIGMRRKRFRHESELHKRLYAGLVKRVEDAVENRPAIDGLSGRVFRVDVGRSPLQRAPPSPVVNRLCTRM